MSKKLIVDADLCIGCGACEDNHPDSFKVDGDPKLSKVIAPYDEAKKDEIQDAIDNCPAGAISIKKTDDPPAM